jgi:hypothetical protein
LSEIYTYFKETGLVKAFEESNKFYTYNANKKWSCLPDWELAADLWIARIGG